jgi:hypothetical protein
MQQQFLNFKKTNPKNYANLAKTLFFATKKLPNCSIMEAGAPPATHKFRPKV